MEETMNIKKTLTIIALLLFPLIFSTITSADISVQPLEISINMDNDFINGNTSKKITITNNNDYNFNVTWYKEHPNPISYLRPNRTYIPELSWIDVEPKWIIIPPKEKGEFYIYLNIPNVDENLGQHWETWVTFKKGERTGSFINKEYAIRVYIDTPEKTTNNGISSITVEDQIKIPLQDVAIALIAIALITTLTAFFLKKKKTKI